MLRPLWHLERLWVSKCHQATDITQILLALMLHTTVVVDRTARQAPRSSSSAAICCASPGQHTSAPHGHKPACCCVKWDYLVPTDHICERGKFKLRWSFVSSCSEHTILKVTKASGLSHRRTQIPVLLLLLLLSNHAKNSKTCENLGWIVHLTAKTMD